MEGRGRNWLFEFMTARVQSVSHHSAVTCDRTMEYSMYKLFIILNIIDTEGETFSCSRNVISKTGILISI